MNLESVAKRLGGICPAGGGDFRPVAEVELRSIQDEIEATIPPEYGSMLRKYGAFTFNGRSENNPYVYFNTKEQIPKHISANGLAIFDFFYGQTQQSGPSGLQQQINFFKERIPKTMIPIASDGGAGQICLGIKDDDFGKIFYWDMANEPLDEETYLEDYGEPMPAEGKRQNIYLIADSLVEFLDQLVLMPVA